MSQPVPVFTGLAKGGRVEWDLPAAARQWVQGLEGERIEVTIRRHKAKRSDPQNRAWWGLVVPAIAEELGYDRHEYEAVHYALVAKCFGTTTVDGLEIPNKRSSKLNTAEFAELMDWAARWAATELGIQVPLPDDAEAA